MITPGRVRQLVREGRIPRAGRGEYELVPVVQGYITYLRDEAGAQRRERIEPDGLRAQQVRLAKAKADAAEAENERRLSRMLPIDGAVRVISEILVAAKATFRGLPASVAITMSLTRVQTRQLQKAVDGALRELAESGAKIGWSQPDQQLDSPQRKPKRKRVRSKS